MRARYYDPATGRFNRLDPFFGNAIDPQSFHKYLYTHADPINRIDPSGNMSLGSISIAMAIGGGLAGASVGASVSYFYGATSWREIGAGAFSGLVSGAMLGAAYGFSIGTGRFPIVFSEGLVAGASNAVSDLLSQIVISPFDSLNAAKIGSAFIDGLVWGTAASAFGGSFINKNLNGGWKKVFDDDFTQQIKYAVITSVGKDIANYVSDLIIGNENKSFSDFLVETLINASKAGVSVAILRHAIEDSNIPTSEIAVVQLVTAFIINTGIGTWIDVARDYVLEYYVP